MRKTKWQGIGFARSTTGNDVHIDFGDLHELLDMITVHTRKENQTWDLYCNNIKVTIELVSEEETRKYVLRKKNEINL